MGSSCCTEPNNCSKQHTTITSSTTEIPQKMSLRGRTCTPCELTPVTEALGGRFKVDAANPHASASCFSPRLWLESGPQPDPFQSVALRCSVLLPVSCMLFLWGPSNIGGRSGGTQRSAMGSDVSGGDVLCLCVRFTPVVYC